jgi:DNA helicase HerA-like ATPase
MTYRLNPGEKHWWSAKALPLAAEGDEDVLGLMSGLLRDGTVAWQSLLPERFGEATVSVRLEEQSGDLIIGRQINVRVRTKFLERILGFSSVTTGLLGILGISAAVFIKISEILGDIGV